MSFSGKILALLFIIKIWFGLLKFRKDFSVYMILFYVGNLIALPCQQNQHSENKSRKNNLYKNQNFNSKIRKK